ncbi:DUF294 nucleotidyltransferase-like domain-containing protein [Salipaludibacillus sp. CUR1]|uniref:DUF294 nucleotidyltransferase-like domain-containing protein n=1 Tax=Salipaludibacillus sp. CUR1 TaxID=2820003 RepID=UPI001E294F92|nr:DUF294 nucleotidyltransferase-like domain-containing protein [Salipaludibacillus sp. CUR1]MCE7792350.1 DUF294 nucleotidyltransferase-like domain-containing protein [Salipaludibacillus sp. CUR1]
MTSYESYKDLIRRHFPFDLLTDDQFKRLIDESKRQSFSENEFVFHEEDEEIEVHFLLKGLAKNVLHRENGQQFSVRFYYPGDLIGLMILLAGGQLNFSVQALENCETVQFKKSILLKIMTENEAFSNVILSGIGNRMKSLYDEIKKERHVTDAENIGLFRTRVHSIMERAKAIHQKRTLKEAAKLMTEERLAGLVVLDDKKELKGVITQQHVIRGFLHGQSSETVTEWMEDKPHTIQEGAFSYEVLTFFKDDYIDLVPVMNGERVVGILMAESFLQLQDSKYLNLSYRLQHAEKVKELAHLSPKNNDDFLSFTEALLNERTHPSEVCEFISNYNDQIHRKVIQFALRDMLKEGYGKPPVNYCFVVMGSQGRKEQAFSTDQDNALILDNYQHLSYKREVEEFFHRFAAKVNEALAKCGFPECSGGIMAKERKWCREINEWKSEVVNWVKKADSQEIRDFTIFIDYRPIYGDFSLAEKLRDDIIEPVKKGKILHAMLMKDTIRFRVPINALGRISVKGKKKTIDLKKSALMQIVNGVRIFAIRYGITEVSTAARLDRLEELEIFHPRDVKNAKLAMDYLHYFRIMENISQLRKNDPLSNMISPLKLDKDEKKQLKDALFIAKRLQQMSELSFAKNRGI